MAEAAAESELTWASPGCLEIGAALLAADQRSATARELQATVGTHQSNVKKRADEMVVAGLLADGGTAATQRRGPRPTLYVLPDNEVEHVAAQLTAARVPGRVVQGQHFVIADARAASLEDLFIVLGNAAAAGRVRWAAFSQGERPEYLMMFDDHDGDAATELVAALDAAGVDALSAAVGQVELGPELVSRARRAVAAAAHARMRSVAHRSG